MLLTLKTKLPKSPAFSAAYSTNSLKVSTIPFSEIVLAKPSIASLICLEIDPSPSPLRITRAFSLASILAIAAFKSEGSYPKKEIPF